MTPGDYSATTGSFIVTVRPFFLEDQSEPDENRFVWAYRVQIHNTDAPTAKLMSRTWVIIDGRGHTISVEGPGVVGEQPLLEPGETFEYTSGTPLETSSGIMRGTYRMVSVSSGEIFDIVIPTFSLDSPHGAAQRH